MGAGVRGNRSALAGVHATSVQPVSLIGHAPKKANKKTITTFPISHPLTIIVIKYDIGYGNNLYIRGEGAGLSWDLGIQMENVGRDVWIWTTNQIADGFIKFRVLINDELWSVGSLSVPAGETTTLIPQF